MKLTGIDQFVKALAASHLLTADELKTFWTALPAGERPKEAAGLARLLIEAGRLNEFQADEILAGRDTPLVLGDYVLIGKIGAGGMGQVFKAEHRVMKRRVAVKLLPPALTQDAAAVKRFQREVQAAARLSHANIVAALDARVERGISYLVMEYVEGRDLSALVKERGPLPVEQAVDFVLQAARGLAFAHAEHVIHRDIKPANLLVDKKGVVKILDMGLARFDGGDDGLTGTEQVMGTVDYMSPEQAANTKGVDARADIYSLGCTLWYLLTGRKVYEADTMIARLMAHRDLPPPSLVKQRDDVPWPLEQTFHKMIAKRPQDRQQTMDEVIAGLEPYAPAPRGGMGSSIGMGSATSPELAAFLSSVKSPTTLGPAAVPGKSTLVTSRAAVAPDDATEAFKSGEAGTDPQSEVLPKKSLSPAATKAQPEGRGGRAKKPPVKLIAGGTGALALVILAGIIVTIKNKDGDVVATVAAPTGATVEVSATPDSSVSQAPPAAGTSITATNVIELLESPDYAWSEPENLGQPVNDFGEQNCATLTADQLRMIFVRLGGHNDIYECRRTAVNEPFGTPKRLPVDTAHESDPHLSGNGLFLAYDVRDPNAELRTADIRLRRRSSLEEEWGPAETLTEINSAADDRRPWISDDGLTLIFDSNRPGGFGNDDLYIAQRPSANVPFGTPQNLGKGINTGEREGDVLLLGDGKTLLFLRGNKWMYSYRSKATGLMTAIELTNWPANFLAPWLSPDCQTLYFCSSREGGHGNDDIWVCRRVPRSNAAVGTVAAATSPNPTAATTDVIKLLESPDYVWSEPENLGPNINGAGDEFSPCLTTDQLHLLFKSNRGGSDLHETNRRGISEPFGPAVQLRSGDYENNVSMSGNGLFLVYSVGDARSGVRDGGDLYLRRRVSLDEPWLKPQPISEVNSTSHDGSPWISDDGLTLIFDSLRPGGFGQFDLYIARRKSADAPFGPPTNLGSVINTTENEGQGQILGDGQTLWFKRQTKRMYSYRSTTTGALTAIELTNWPEEFATPWLAPDGRTVYFHSTRPGGFGKSDLWVSRRVPKSSASAAGTSPVTATQPSSQSFPSARDFALQFDGDQAAVTIPNLLRDDAGPFTLECWIRNPTAATMPVVRVNGRAPIQLHLHKRQPHGAERNEWDKVGRDSAGPEIAGDQWTHVAYVVGPGESRLFVNGKSVNVQAKPAPKLMTTAKFGDGWIGSERFDPSVASQPFEGEIDELRVSKVARYTPAGFIPARRHEPDADTLALYHFDEGTGDELRDSSGRNLHGKILGAKWVPGDATSSSDGPGATSSDFAIDFTGINGAHFKNLSFDSNRPLTMECVVKPLSLPTEGDQWNSPVVNMGWIQVKLFSRPIQGRHSYSCILHHENNTLTTIGLGPAVVGRATHIAISSNGREVCCFFDGKLVRRAPVTSPLKNSTGCGVAAYNAAATTGWGSFPGLIDEVRFSTVARYDDDYLPRARLEADGDTALLLHFDEVSGETVRDSSANGERTTVAGAKWVPAGAMSSPSPPAGTALQPSGPSTDLLALVDPSVHARNGKWEKVDGALLSPTSINASIELPIEPASAYRLELVARRLKGGDDLCIGILTGTSDARVVLEGYKNLLSGLEYVDNVALPQQPAAYRLPVFTAGVPSRITVDVSPTSVRCTVDDDTIVDWTGDGSRLKLMRPEYRLTKKCLFLGTYASQFRITSLTYAPLTAGAGPSADQPPHIAPAFPPAPAKAPLSATSTKLFLHDPAFPQWLKDVQALPAERQIEAVSKKLMELNPGFDGKLTGLYWTGTPKIEDGVVTLVGFQSDHIADISPLRAFVGLTTLGCKGISQADGKLTDLSPVAGMPLVSLHCVNTPLVDLSPLVTCRDLSLLSVTRTKVTAAGVAALQKALPNCKIEWDEPAKATTIPGATDSSSKLFLHDPAFPQWLQDVQALPAEAQIEAVGKKLAELNPGFDGSLKKPIIVDGQVHEVTVDAVHVVDLSPLRALSRLRGLSCVGSRTARSRLFDLSPLAGLPLTSLSVSMSQVSDLSPLRDMRLTHLSCFSTEVVDLSVLAGMPLDTVYVGNTRVASIEPLRGTNLRELHCDNTKISSLEPLSGSRLELLRCSNTAVSSLTPLGSCKKLRSVGVAQTKVNASEVAALKQALPACEITWDDPAKAVTKPAANASDSQ